MKILLDVKFKRKPEDGDILFFQNGKLEVIDKITFLGDVEKEILDLRKENGNLKKELDTFKENVNEKLKDYHEVLNTLTKKEN